MCVCPSAFLVPDAGHGFEGVFHVDTHVHLCVIVCAYAKASVGTSPPLAQALYVQSLDQVACYLPGKVA